MSKQIFSMDCLNHGEGKSECGINIYTLTDPREIRSQIATCGIDCHLMVLSCIETSKGMETMVFFTACSRVRETLERVLGPGEIFPCEDHFPRTGEHGFAGVCSQHVGISFSRADEHSFVGVYFRRIGIRVGDGPDAPWKGLTTEEFLAALREKGEAFTVVEKEKEKKRTVDI